MPCSTLSKVGILEPGKKVSLLGSSATLLFVSVEELLDDEPLDDEPLELDPELEEEPEPEEEEDDLDDSDGAAFLLFLLALDLDCASTKD